MVTRFILCWVLLSLGQCRKSLIGHVNSRNAVNLFYIYNSETNNDDLDGIIYIGKQPEEIQLNFSITMVSTLTKPMNKTSRKLKCDNSFTSVDLNLLKIGLSSLGTIRQNKRDVHP